MVIWLTFYQNKDLAIIITEQAFFCFSSLFCFIYAVVEFFLMVYLLNWHPLIWNIPKTYHVCTFSTTRDCLFCSPPCFALHMLSLNSFWWLIYGRVIINFDLVLSPDFFFAAQCETRFVKEGLFVVDEAKFKSAMTKQMLPHSVAAWVHIGLKINNFVQYCVVSRIPKLHLGSKCLVRLACSWSKMPMFQRAGMQEGGLPLPPAFQYLILVVRK